MCIYKYYIYIVCAFVHRQVQILVGLVNLLIGI